MDILIPPLVLGGLGMILGLMIYFVAFKFGVEEDHTVQDVEHLLPNYNCGACGFPGCKGLAEAIVSGKAVPTQCKPIKKEEVDILNKYLEALKAGTPIPAATK